MEKYIGAVVRKSFQLEIVAEIGPFENFGPQSNFVQYINEKDSFEKIKTILTPQGNLSWMLVNSHQITLMFEHEKLFFSDRK